MSVLMKTGALTLCVVALGVGACDRVRPMTFESQQWRRDHQAVDLNTRERMAADLLERRSLLGRSRSDVIAQLGDPDNIDRRPLPSLYYEIRVDYGSDIDPVSVTDLVVEFGSNDRVDNVRTRDWKIRD